MTIMINDQNRNRRSNLTNPTRFDALIAQALQNPLMFHASDDESASSASRTDDPNDLDFQPPRLHGEEDDEEGDLIPPLISYFFFVMFECIHFYYCCYCSCC